MEKIEMERITRKNLLESLATEKELKAFDVATASLKAKYCGIERYNTAKRCVSLLTRINNLKEKSDRLDSEEFTSKYCKWYDDRIDELQARLSKYAGKLGLKVFWNTYCHLSLKVSHGVSQVI